MSEKATSTIFSTNLKNSRGALGLTQQKAADLLGIKLKTYQKYEEGRAAPAIHMLAALFRTMKITDTIGFLENEAFDHKHQENSNVIIQESQLDHLYASAGPKSKKIVDLALAIKNDEVTC